MNYTSVTALFLFNETHDPSQANGSDAKKLERKAQFGGYESGVACSLASCCKEKTHEQ